MKCSFVRVGDTTAIVCGSQKIPTCAFCGAIAGLLCDYPTTRRKTCDKRLCRACATNIAPNVDHCPDHPVPASQLAMEFTR